MIFSTTRVILFLFLLPSLPPFLSKSPLILPSFSIILFSFSGLNSTLVHTRQTDAESVFYLPSVKTWEHHLKPSFFFPNTVPTFFLCCLPLFSPTNFSSVWDLDFLTPSKALAVSLYPLLPLCSSLHLFKGPGDDGDTLPGFPPSDAQWWGKNVSKNYMW